MQKITTKFFYNNFVVHFVVTSPRNQSDHFSIFRSQSDHFSIFRRFWYQKKACVFFFITPWWILDLKMYHLDDINENVKLCNHNLIRLRPTQNKVYCKIHNLFLYPNRLTDLKQGFLGRWRIVSIKISILRIGPGTFKKELWKPSKIKQPMLMNFSG